MSHNIHQNPSCQYAEQTVSYLYGEGEANERVEFETHLENCPVCADEIANFGIVRSSILEWRDADFSNLATPTFTLPTAVKEISSPVAATESGSWLAEFRRMFSLNPAFAATASAIAVVAVGIALLTFNFSGNKETSGRQDEEDLAKATVSPTIETVKKAEANFADNKPEKHIAPTATTDDSPKEKDRARSVHPEKAVVKVSATAAKNNSNNSAVVPKEKNDKKLAPVKKPRVPNLSNADEDEDKTVRLADLFDELDTK